MFWDIILLEILLILSHLQTFNDLLHSLLQNLTIFHCIHLPLHLYQHPHPIPAHTSSNHQVIPPSMLDSWCDGPVCYWFPLLLPNIHLPIWPNPIDFCLISLQHLLPVLHSPISIVLGKFYTLLTMRPLKHRDFLLCCWPKASFLQHIPNSLRSNRVGYGGIYELGGLDSIIKLPRADLMDNWLFITRGKLGRMATRMIFLISLHLPTNPANSILSQAHPSLNLIMGIPLIEERNNRRVLFSKDGFHKEVR